jgi:hypothetical protein
MQKHWIQALALGIGLTAMATAGCGGDIVGIGNSGNRFFNDELDELADALAVWPDVPDVKEEDLSRIYRALLQRAREGDPQSARVILALAQHQRRAREDD